MYVEKYRAREMYPGDWIVEREFICINGLLAWFPICACTDDDTAQRYTDGAYSSAKSRTEEIAAALNKVNNA